MSTEDLRTRKTWSRSCSIDRWQSLQRSKDDGQTAHRNQQPANEGIRKLVSFESSDMETRGGSVPVMGIMQKSQTVEGW